MKNIYKIRLLIATVIFILAILAAVGVFYPVKIFNIQFLPLFQRVIVDFSIISIGLLLGIILLTIFFGRLYCSILCPFGIMQEIFALIFKKKNKVQKNRPIKYFILAVTFGALIAGCAKLIRYFDPYTNFCSLASLSVIGITLSIIVLILVLFKNRYFCTNICPIGAILGLLSKISINKIYIDKNLCVNCSKCASICPSGCIDFKNGIIDNEICTKCLKCLSVCPKNAVKYGIKQDNKEKFNPKRRDFILFGAIGLVFLSTIKTTLILKDKAIKKFKEIILPAGAVDSERFLDKCLNCNLCVQNCPNKIIKKANDEYNAVHIDYTNGYCKKDCNVCSCVCPSGAIKKISLEEKQKTRIAMASIDYEKCKNCSICVYECPYGAIEKIDNKIIINAKKCVGCGKCKQKCRQNAIEIFAIKEQIII